MSGSLFVVATPIGNLEDLTFRALRTLREVDVIAAEDTRRTSKLLAHYEIRKSLVSLHEHNEVREAPRLVQRLLRGESIALVTDAGTPGIADPGARLVRAAREADVPIFPIPGASAVATALSISGFSGSEFVFMGFPPRSGRDRSDWFDRLSAEPRVVIFFEAPHRIQRTAAEALSKLGTRPILICREISKIHEEYITSPNIEDRLLRQSLVRGEFALVVGETRAEPEQEPDTSSIYIMFGLLTDHGSIDETTAIKLTSAAYGTTPDVVKKAIKKNRILVKRQLESSS